MANNHHVMGMHPSYGDASELWGCIRTLTRASTARMARYGAGENSTMTIKTQGLRAIICEDEGVTVMQLKKGLQRAGYTVVGEAVEGAAGVQLARDLEPDFVLMDLTMPGMDGITATRKIMEERPIPIIILTAYSDNQSVEAALDAGACAYLVKPIDSSQLIPAVITAIARFEMMENVKRENTSVKDALETRKLVERAKGD